MADRIISTANLSAIESSLHRLSQGLDEVYGQVSSVDTRVAAIDGEMKTLANEFREFVTEHSRQANLTNAKQNVVILRQEMEKKFGHHAIVRRHTTGILQATDISLVRQNTVATATEELMLQAPGYWLAPALITLASWINDDKALAERALKEAIRRDDEKTSLFFCLISRRADRPRAVMHWLDRYFGMQDPANMDRNVISMLDAFASGVFGPDARSACTERVRFWLDELASRSGFHEAQQAQWENALRGRTASIDDQRFSYLVKYSPTWARLREVLAWAETHARLKEHFAAVLDASAGNVATVIAQIDHILDDLVANYDEEETPLYWQLRANQLMIEENGVANRATVRLNAERPAFEPYADFGRHLTSIVLFPESSRAMISTQKFALSLSKPWVISAYADMTAKSRVSVPDTVGIKIGEWHGKTTDGDNEAELKPTLNRHIDKLRDDLLAKVKWFGSNIVIAVIIALIVGYLAGFSGIVFLLALLGAAVYIGSKINQAKRKKREIREEYERLRGEYGAVLSAALADMVDFRRQYAQRDSDYTQTMEQLESLKPEQYISAGETGKTRQVMQAGSASL